MGDPHLHTPRHLLRRWLTLHLLRRYRPSTFVEIGCGRGELLLQLARRGWTGYGLEPGPAARDVAQALTRSVRDKVAVVAREEELGATTFDLVCALEVLEHVLDDRSAVETWRRFMKPGGVMVLSVPAHPSRWTVADDLVGHHRRYERRQFSALLTACGLSVETLWSYGFPLTELSWRARRVAYRHRMARVLPLSPEERTHLSSFDSIRQVSGHRLMTPALEALVYPFHLLQLGFRATDLGDGYLVACRAR